LTFEGEWQNDSKATRMAILQFLSQAPGQHITISRPGNSDLQEKLPPRLERPYVNLVAFINDIQRTSPDFQRPAGDYDSWFIRDQESGAFLRGFASWNQVDGALIRFMISGIMSWLGLVDLAEAPVESRSFAAHPAAFRMSQFAQALLFGSPPDDLVGEEERWLVRANGEVKAPRLSSRAARFQLARFCAWRGFDGNAYRYQITDASLERARGQGLRIKPLLSLMRRQATTVPPTLVRGLERWDEQGSEVSLEMAMVLKVKSPEVLQTIRKGRLSRFFGEQLGPTTIIVKPGARQAVIDGLLEMGMLCEVNLE